MVKNCVAKWDAHQCSTPIHLWLRNNIFYCRMELPRINGKRRYKRISLHTNNYYEARTLMNEQQELLNNIQELRQLYRQLEFKPSDFPYVSSGQSVHVMQSIGHIKITRELSSWNSKSLLEKVWKVFKKLEIHEKQKQLPSDVQTMMVEIRANRDVFDHKINITIEPNNTTTNKVIVQPIISAAPPLISNEAKLPFHPIQEIFDSMLLKANNKKASNIRKKNMLEDMLKKVGLSWKDDYSKLHDVKVIEQISRNVLSLAGIKNGGKKSRLACIKELVTCACNMEPDFYKSNVIANLPNIKKDSIKTVKGHLPYSKDQLFNIFNPKHSFFEQNPDSFWICMIGLFTGSRANAAITLQYDDIINESGIDCIHFQSNHQAKQLKNDASERKVPIHKQLLDLGFVDYVKRKKAKTKATGTDFIFDDAVTKKNQEYNNKYILRTITPFLKEIGAKKDNKDGYDFHSFRKTISIALQDTGIPNSYINDIIGWTPDNTMEQSYSNHTLAQIKEQLDKFEYEFLKPHFDKWKTIMSKKS